MRSGLLSDAHLDHNNPLQDLEQMLPEKGSVDLMLLLGDIADYRQIPMVLRHVRDQLECDVVFVPGNHEYFSYGNNRPSMWEIEQGWEDALSSEEKIHFLQNRSITLGGVHFFGSTWWSSLGTDAERKQFYSGRFYVPDCERIVSASAAEVADGPLLLDFRDMVDMNRLAVDAYRKWWTAAPAGLRVLLTHFPVLAELAHPGFPRNPYFVSDDDQLMIEHKPDLILFGHTHANFSKEVHGIACRSNMFGYPGERGAIGYDRELVLPF